MLACRAVLRQRIFYQPKTCILQRGWLGSSAQNSPSSAFALRWERVKGEVVQQQLPCATSLFVLATLKMAQITQSKLDNEQLLHGQPLLHAVHAALLPSKPCHGNARGRPWQATVA